MRRVVLFALSALGLFVFYREGTRDWDFKLKPTPDDKERIFHIKFLWRRRVLGSGVGHRWCFVEARDRPYRTEHLRSVRYNGAVTRICHARRI